MRTKLLYQLTSVDYRIPGLDGDEHDDKRHIAEMLRIPRNHVTWMPAPECTNKQRCTPRWCALLTTNAELM